MRLGHIEIPDTVEGEKVSVSTQPVKRSYELIDENLYKKVINKVPWSKIPIVYIKCTRNNTKITLATSDNHIIASKSGGTEGFKNCRKSTTVAAQAVANRILTIINDNEISQVRLCFEGLGPGRDPAFKVFEMAKLPIVSFTDRTQAAEPFNLRPRATKSI